MKRDPRIFSSGETSNIRCVSPSSSNYPDGDHYWWIGDVMVTMPMFACYRREGCKCPRIHDASPGRLGVLDNTKYLNHREQFSAKLTISDACEVSGDISKSTVDNFFLLLIRYPQNPIFFSRFSPAHNKNEPVELTDLNCVQEGDKYVWNHGHVKIADFIEMTLLSDEECGCDDLYTINGIEATRVEGSCNVFRVTAPDSSFFIMMSDDTGSEYIPMTNSLPWDVSIAQMTCVNKSWYYSGHQMTAPGFGYYQPNPILKLIDYKCPCEEILYSQDIASYTLDKDTCRLNLSCANEKTLRITSTNNDPMTFSPGSPIDIQCAKQPATAGVNCN